MNNFEKAIIKPIVEKITNGDKFKIRTDFDFEMWNGAERLHAYKIHIRLVAKNPNTGLYFIEYGIHFTNSFRYNKLNTMVYALESDIAYHLESIFSSDRYKERIELIFGIKILDAENE